jgi:hypothetical protein
MSGSIGASGINYALLFQSTPSTNASTDILNAIYGLTPVSTTGTSLLDPITALKVAQQGETADVALEAKLPTVTLPVAAFTKAIQSATSIKSLLANPDFLKVFLTANGLGDQTAYTALATQALLSDPSNTGSLANQLSTSNSAWLTTANTYNFFTNGLTNIQKPSVIASIANGYAEVLWRQSLDVQTPGLSNALYFIANASSLTSADAILGNSVARTVVQTAFGIPQQIAFQPLEAQEKAISSNVDFTQLTNTKYVQNITDQYLVQLQATSSSSSSSSSVSTLFA